MHVLREHRVWCGGYNFLKFTNPVVSNAWISANNRLLSTLVRDKPHIDNATFGEAGSAGHYVAGKEPVAIVLPHSVVDLKRPAFLENACIDAASLKSSLQLPDAHSWQMPLSEPTSPTLEKSPKTKQSELLWQASPAPITDVSALLNKYLMLSKFRLTSLVVITSMGGYAMSPAPFELSTFMLCAAGTGLCSAAANAINQYHEVPFDAQMSRTKNRVLVKGLLTPLHAVGFATVAATSGLSALYWGCNGLTCALGAGNLILYTMVYTPMKRYSILNTWVGSVVGAIPPVMGWVGCSGAIDSGAWILAGLLYAWQFPHFNALSWNLRPEYSRAGYRMMAVTDPGLCRRVALRYCAVIMALSLAAPALDVTNVWFALETLPLNGWFGWLAWRFYKDSDSNSSRKLFRFSLLHLPVLMLLFLLNKNKYVFAEDNTVSTVEIVAPAIDAVHTQ